MNDSCETLPADDRDYVASPPGFAPERRNGAQAVERALTLLLQVARDDGSGQRLTDLAGRTGLDAATARRLLSTLARHGFVEQDPTSRRYYLGLEFFSLAAAASNRRGLGTTARDVLERLRLETGATAAFCLRSGLDLVCIDISRPANDCSNDSIDMGWRRPIGAGAFGIAVLAALPETEGENVAIANVRRISRAPEQAIRVIRQELIAARKNGFAHTIDPATGETHMAVAIVNRKGEPEGALGICLSGAANDNGDLLRHIQVLNAQAHAMEQVVWQLGTMPPAKAHASAKA